MSSMYVTVALWLLLLAWPAIAVIVDGAAGIRAHGLRYASHGDPGRLPGPGADLG